MSDNNVEEHFRDPSIINEEQPWMRVMGGYKPDPEDSRDFKFKAAPTGSLPQSYNDIKPNLSSVRYQQRNRRLP